MAATVLNSERAVAMSVLVVRAFVRLRRLLATHAEIARKLADLSSGTISSSKSSSTRFAKSSRGGRRNLTVAASDSHTMMGCHSRGIGGGKPREAAAQIQPLDALFRDSVSRAYVVSWRRAVPGAVANARHRQVVAQVLREVR